MSQPWCRKGSLQDKNNTRIRQCAGRGSKWVSVCMIWSPKGDRSEKQSGALPSASRVRNDQGSPALSLNGVFGFRGSGGIRECFTRLNRNMRHRKRSLLKAYCHSLLNWKFLLDGISTKDFTKLSMVRWRRVNLSKLYIVSHQCREGALICGCTAGGQPQYKRQRPSPSPPLLKEPTHIYNKRDGARSNQGPAIRIGPLSSSVIMKPPKSAKRT
jgi:hypothetical protein